MHYHAEAEHQDDGVHRECDGAGAVQDVENAVIAEVDQQRVGGGVTRFPQSDKDAVDDGAAGVGDVERHQADHDAEDVRRVVQSLHVPEKRHPHRDGGGPEQDAGGGNGVVIALPQSSVPVLAVRADDLRQRGDGDQQPAPDKVVGEPVIPLPGHHVHHFADHDGVDEVIDELLQSRKCADPAPFAEHGGVGAPEPAGADVPLPVQQMHAYDGQQHVHEDVGRRRAVNAQLRDEQEVRRHGQHRADGEEDIDIAVTADDHKHHVGEADGDAGDERLRFKTEVGGCRRQVDGPWLHGGQQRRAPEQYADGKERVQQDGAQPRLVHRLREYRPAVFEHAVQHRVQRHDEERLQRLIDKVEPLHLPDDVEHTRLSRQGEQKGLDRLIHSGDQRQRAEGEPQPPVKSFQFRLYLFHGRHRTGSAHYLWFPAYRMPP